MPPKLFETFLKLLSCAGILFLVYMAGVVSAVNKGYFYWKVQEFKLYTEALKEWDALRQDNFMMLYKARNGASGVTVDKPDKTFRGLTLYTDYSPSAYLIDEQGGLVHSWHFSYKDAFPDTHLDLRYIYWHGTKLMPNGDLFGIYESPNSTPYGAGLVKLDKDSRLLWKLPLHTHHDLDIAPDGRVFVLFQTIEEKPLPGMEFLRPPFLHDHVAILNPNGEEIKRVSVLQALKNSGFAYVLEKLPVKQGDLTHINSVRFITPEMAAIFPQAKAGELLLSIPKAAAIALLDPEQEKITWLKTGVWGPLHSVSLLPGGHIMMFDNWGKPGTRQSDSSRIIEYDPGSDSVAWSYEGTPDHPLFSESRGAAQSLANGNVLITESDKGRLLEVTREGEPVWEFYCPVRAGKDKELISVVNSGTRYTLDELPFLLEKP